MSKQEMVVAIITVSMIGGTVMTFITSWFRYREKQLEVERRTVATGDNDRLARIEAAVDAMAVEVERISEGQRFTSKLLAERQHPAAPVGAGERRAQLEER